MVCTAGPTLSVPVSFGLACRNPSACRNRSGMAVMAGSASSQHASAPLGATAHLFNPCTETVGEGSGVSLTEVGRIAPTGGAVGRIAPLVAAG